MANTRVYDEVDGMKFAGSTNVLVGGMTRIDTSQSYQDQIQYRADSVQGVSDTAEAGQRVTFALNTTDVIKGIDLLINTFASAEWFGREAVTALYGKGVLAGPKCHTLAFAASSGQAATINVDGECVFPSSAAEFANVEVFLAGQAAPTQTRPKAQWQPKSATHGTVLASVLHLQGVTFRMTPRIILLDRDGGDKGITSVVVPGYGITVELTFRDTTPQLQVTLPHDLATALMGNGVADLVVPFTGIADTAAMALTIRNVKWLSKRKAGAADWTGFTLSGVALFRDVTGTTLVTRTINDAVATDRMINWA